jgi:SNF2 family DNA or RNA helicase
MLIEEQINLRKKRAEEGKFRVKRKCKGAFGEYEVKSFQSNNTYFITLRSLELGKNLCTCPDFYSNTLGTCKHIEAVINRIKRLPEREREKDFNKFEIYLDYGNTINVKAWVPVNSPDKIQNIVGRYFDKEHNFSKHLSKFSQLLDELEELDDNAKVYSDVMEHVERQLEIEENLQIEREFLKELDEGKFKLDIIKANLYPYQIRGVLFAAFRGRVLIGDDMGLGKTVQAIAASELLMKDEKISKILIICPASLKYQWKYEIEKFTDKNPLVLKGTRNKRIIQYEEESIYKITNYEAVLRDRDLIMNWKPDMIILDEAQRIKNWETKVAKAVKLLKSKHAIVLTGTPLENKLEELYSIVQFIDNRQLGPAFQFFHNHIKTDEFGKALGYKNLDLVRENLKSIFLRRKKEEVLKQLPPKTENVYYTIMLPEQLNPYEEQRAIVARILHKWKAKRWISEIDRKRLLCAITNMRMICDSTYLYDKKTNFSPKLKEFKELIREICIDNDKKVVVFSQWARMLKKASEVANELKINNVLFYGEVPVEKRGELIKEFMENEDCKIFFSTDAGGLGLNLQNADTVINLDVPWNPAVLDQRISRVHRLGQHNPVTAINLITKNSIEERVLETIKIKRMIFTELFEGKESEIDFSSLKKEPFINMVNELMEKEISESERQKEEIRLANNPVDNFIESGIKLLSHFFEEPQKTSAGNINTSDFSQSKFIKTDLQTGEKALHIPLPSEEILKKTFSLFIKALTEAKQNRT